MHFFFSRLKIFLVSLIYLGFLGCAHDPLYWSVVLPEQREIEIRPETDFPKPVIPELAPLDTVSDPLPEDAPIFELSLDKAIHIALSNSKVVRVLAGITAVSSGQTIYDPAISNTIIDQERGRFDPRLEVLNSWDRIENPQAFIDPINPVGTTISGTSIDRHSVSTSLRKTSVTGAEASVTVNDNVSRFRPGTFPLDPENRFSTTLQLNQPLLQGAARRANVAPIVIAQINTDQSFYQYKDSLQELVRSVVDAYWALVFARTNVWAREQQVLRAKEAYRKAALEAKIGRASFEQFQAKTTLANFEADLVSAKADLLQREAALRNILNLPPSDGQKLVPITPPIDQRFDINWQKLVELAEQRRPDLVQQKLAIEADQQLIYQAKNRALPRVDAVALYRLNGLEGASPTGDFVSSLDGRFNDWMLGLNISLPLGLRQDRAILRQQQLALARDRAILDQGLKFAIHDLATSLRNLAKFHEQYLKFKEARKAAELNQRALTALFLKGGLKERNVTFVDVRLAIADLGNAISAEAQALSQYNTELATLERETGTILETHGIFFHNERFPSRGPLIFPKKTYPKSMPPSKNVPRYKDSDKPAEEFFDLVDPLEKPKPEKIPLPKPVPKELLPKPDLLPKRKERPPLDNGVIILRPRNVLPAIEVPLLIEQ